MKILALSIAAALGLAATPVMAQQGAAGGNASESGLGALSTEAWVFAGVAAAATVAVVSDSSSNPIIDPEDPEEPEEPEEPGTTVTVTGTGTNTYTITVPVQ